MRISGFTLLRNGVEFDYPFEESLRSLLPLVDELIINVGVGTDSTLERVLALQESHAEGHKISIFESHWPLDNPDKKRGGQILSEQTNLALDRCTGDWCVYLQADEVLHEGDVTKIREALKAANAQSEIQALLFDYVHFYGSFDVIRTGRRSYRREVRAIRRSSGARSIGDAQSFRASDGDKLRVAHSGATVYHYGWVRTPEAMRAKTFFMDQLYHGEPTAEAQASGIPHTGDNYRYKRVHGLRRFTGSHPAVMIDRIQRKNWHWDLEHSPLVWKGSDVRCILLDALERLTGYRFFEYRSYRE